MLVKESIETLTSGQQYAVDFLKTIGLTLISSPLQLKRGNLIFQENNGMKWSIFRNGGYIRRWRGGEWAVLYITKQGKMIEDDEYIELTHILSEKVRKKRAKDKRDKDPNVIAAREERQRKARIKGLFEYIKQEIEQPRSAFIIPLPLDDINDIREVIIKLNKIYHIN